MIKLRYIVEAKDVNRFKYCPYCGSNMISVNDGDYNGQTECLNCNDEMEFIILEEDRNRNSKGYKKMIRS